MYSFPNIEEVDPRKISSKIPLSLLQKKNKIRKLKRQVKELQVLDNYIISENECLKNQGVKLREVNDELKEQIKLLSKSANKWLWQNKKIRHQNRLLRIKLMMQKRDAWNKTRLDILVATIEEETLASTSKYKKSKASDV